MTAEVAILNRTAVALAADSAVSSLLGQNTKIYNSVNKLFALSKRRPVGVMIYGQADLMGVPWESIIKVFRDDLGARSCNRLSDYADTFIAFLEGSRMLFPEALQESFAGQTAVSYYRSVLSAVEKRVETAVQNASDGITPDEVMAIIAEELAEEERLSSGVSFLPNFDEGFEEELRDTYRPKFQSGIQQVFQEIPFSEEQNALLIRLASRLFCRDRGFTSLSGFVIAGFGESETYPSLFEYHSAGMIRNRLIFKRQETCNVETEGPTIVPFAQSDMVHTFMVGIDPRYREVVDTYVSTVLEKLPDEVMRALPEGSLSEDLRATYRERLLEAGRALSEDLTKRLNEYGHQTHVAPIVAAVGMLPKGELAEMAESLVNLTSFKKKMSIEAETVGGPIDVAVISKGDGFVWIKRKHYFKGDLNPMFFANYQKRSVED